jgi:alpha-methylacyl-CoA racemase
VAPVQRFDELTADPQFASNGTFVEAPAGSGRVTQVSIPLRSPAIEPPQRSAAVAVGAHTAEVLAECGLDPERVEALTAPLPRPVGGLTPIASEPTPTGAGR